MKPETTHTENDITFSQITVGLSVTRQAPLGSRRAKLSHRALRKYSLPQRLSCHYELRTRLPITLGASNNMWFLYSELFN